MTKKPLFDKIFVVSLPGSPRRRLLSERFSPLGMEYEIWDAADPREVGTDWLLTEQARLGRTPHPASILGWQYASAEAAARASVDINFSYDFLTPSIVACNLSHALIYEEVISQEWQRILICEDDITFRPDAREIIEAVSEELDQSSAHVHFDIIAFQTFCPPTEQDRRFAKTARSPVIGVASPGDTVRRCYDCVREFVSLDGAPPLRNVYRSLSHVGGTGCYMITKTAAEHLLSVPYIRHADATICEETRVDSPIACGVATPLPAYVPDAESERNTVDKAIMGFTPDDVRRYL